MTPAPPYEPALAPRAGFGDRLAGLILDVLLYGLAGSVLLVPAAGLLVEAVQDCARDHGRVRCAGGQLRGGLLAGGIALGVFGVVALATVYLLALGHTGQTWGRRIAHVRVAGRTTGQPLGVGRAFARQLAEQLLSANCVLGYLWMLWDPHQQTWHDKLTDAVVVKVPR